MKKNVFNLCLLAALLCGLSLGFTSCKDDDNDNGTGDEGQETYEGLSTLEDDQLADLITAWTDTDRGRLDGTAWRNATYEPTVGLVLDESQPGIRYVAVGTTEEADRYAASALSTLGIDYQSPAGFTYTNSQVGTVAYSHSEGNTLGTISVDIRQIPVLQEIRLIKVLPDNAKGDPYYKCGDLVKYNNRFYVCVSNHQYGQEARFITLNDHDTHERGKFTWMGVGKDSVYTDEMAKAEVLGDWLQNVVCNGTMWNSVVSRMVATGNVQNIRQVVPEDNFIRVSLVASLFADYEYTPELHQSNPLGTGPVVLYNFANYGWTETFDPAKHLTTGTFAPIGYLLADKLRYTMVTDKWVPYIFLAKGEETFNKVYDLELTQIPSQYKDASHFKFRALNSFRITQNDQLIGMPSLLDEEKGDSFHNSIKADTYYVCVIGMHWTHDQFSVENMKYKALFNFCASNEYNPKSSVRRYFQKIPTDWCHRNITSRSLTFTDKGQKNKKCDDVSIQ